MRDKPAANGTPAPRHRRFECWDAEDAFILKGLALLLTPLLVKLLSKAISLHSLAVNVRFSINADATAPTFPRRKTKTRWKRRTRIPKMSVFDQIPDGELRAAAFLALGRLRAEKGVLTADDLQAGFEFGGERIPFANSRRGIWKPKRMQRLLSIKTVHPKPGGKIWYSDQYTAREEVYRAEEHVTYAFQGTDPASFDNQWLREAMLNQVPLIYFFGVAPGRYEALFPIFIEDWSAASLSARVAVGRMAGAGSVVVPSDAGDRRYAMREVKQRLHQASFREAILSAYKMLR